MAQPKIIENGDSVVFLPGTDIIASEVPDLRNKLKTIVTNGTKSLEVDLTNINMVDSTGIGLLISLYNSLQKNGGKLSVVHASTDLLELFKSMRIDRHFTITGP